MCLTHITPVTKDNGKQKLSALEGWRIALYSVKTWRNLKIKKKQCLEHTTKILLMVSDKKKGSGVYIFSKIKICKSLRITWVDLLKPG